MIDIKFEEAGFNKQNFQKSHKLKKTLLVDKDDYTLDKLLIFS